MLASSYRTAYDEDHEAFHDTLRRVLAEHLTPHRDEHEANGIVPRAVVAECLHTAAIQSQTRHTPAPIREINGAGQTWMSSISS
jgi:hypothetical protein